uniref:Endonuclease/exonuclease/phosphatase domain-containing protein n=1 Tax=Cyprinodon variegatus TaxID=28743 RepID=A0A3Q2DVR8_CYPVA
MFLSCGSTRAAGVAILFMENTVNNILQCYTDNKGHCVSVTFSAFSQHFQLTNIHAPNVEKDRCAFFRSLDALCSDGAIIVGDFNVWRSRLDAPVGQFGWDGSRTVLEELLSNRDMSEIWRDLNFGVREVSRRQLVLNSLTQSRLDFVIAKRALSSLFHGVHYKFIGFSDHAALKFNLAAIAHIRTGGNGVLIPPY